MQPIPVFFENAALEQAITDYNDSEVDPSRLFDERYVQILESQEPLVSLIMVGEELNVDTLLIADLLSVLVVCDNAARIAGFELPEISNDTVEHYWSLCRDQVLDGLTYEDFLELEPYCHEPELLEYLFSQLAAFELDGYSDIEQVFVLSTALCIVAGISAQLHAAK